MAALAGITINDYDAVTRSYTPISHSSTNVTLRETGLSSNLASGVITLDKLKVKGNGSVEKFRVKLFQPVLEAELAANSEGYTAAPRVAYSLSFTNEFTSPLRATESQRKNVCTIGPGLIVKPIFWDAVVSGIMPY